LYGKWKNKNVIKLTEMGIIKAIVFPWVTAVKHGQRQRQWKRRLTPAKCGSGE